MSRKERQAAAAEKRWRIRQEILSGIQAELDSREFSAQVFQEALEEPDRFVRQEILLRPQDRTILVQAARELAVELQQNMNEGIECEC